MVFISSGSVFQETNSKESEIDGGTGVSNFQVISAVFFGLLHWLLELLCTGVVATFEAVYDSLGC